MAGAALYIDKLRQLDRNSIVLTPNQRLAKYLGRLFQHEQLQAEQTCWQSPVILPINIWLSQSWADYANNNPDNLPLVLNPTQETLLWQQVLSASSYKDYFLRLSETANLVKAARALLLKWKVDLNHSLFDSAEDYTALKHWVTQFQGLLDKNNWIDSATLPALITNQIQQQQIPAPGSILLVGFNEIEPQIQQLLDAAAEHGCSVDSINLSGDQSEQQRISLEQQDDEWYAMARWAKKMHTDNPAAEIGCVIPSLDKQRDRITQIFSEVFADSSEFNISAGRNLNFYPAVYTALKLLRLHSKKISSEELYVILDSPFVAGGESERLRRSAFDRKIRNDNTASFDLQQLSENKLCPILAKRIQKLQVLLEDKPDKATYQEWAHFFNKMLSALGWPGERILNSEEYQVVEQWLSLLKDMRTLDITHPTVDIYEALNVLNQMAASKPFQAKTPPAKVQLLGILEASGICFQHLWISGMDDSAWPTQPNPNPFIPKALQRELKMPHSAAERELEYCSNMTSLFKASADHVIFSHINKRDETLLLPSPLIRDISEITIEQLQLDRFCQINDAIFKTADLENLHDEAGPIIGETETVYGGVSVLKNQALCPFKAFAENRLHAKKLEECIPGFTARDRGTTIHAILDKFWQQVKSNQHFKQMPDGEYVVLLTQIIDETLTTDAAGSNKTYLQLEKERLFRLLHDWLQQEKQRDDFTVVGTEAESEAEIGPLNLTVRIDRIDELPDGSQLIIDYKTGTSCTPSQWFSDRPEEPQLPLYAYISKDSVSAVAFAQIAAGNNAFKGISRDASGIKGIATVQSSKSTDAEDWTEVTARWAAALNHLGTMFYHGNAELDPKKPAATCKHCGLQTLCRINQYSGYAYDE
jgi:ATP-dependent helicase/nuclease subunit B